MTVRAGVDPIVGGYDTARVSAADNDQQRRAQRLVRQFRKLPEVTR